MSPDAKYWFLRNHYLFTNLEREQIKDISYQTEFVTNRKGSVIELSQAESRVYTIKQGILKLIEIHENGQELVIDILRPGDLFGEFPLLTPVTNQYVVSLSDQVTFCSFLTADFEKIIQKYPTLGIRYTKLVGLRFTRLQSLYRNLMFKDVRTRLRLFLKDWFTRDYKPEQPNVVKNYLSHKDIAHLICCNRQTVTELFSEFRGAGLLDYNRTQLTLINPALLDV